MVIDRRSLEQRTRRPNKSVLVRIVDLPLVIVADDELVLPPLDRLEIDMRRDEPFLGQEIIEWLGRGDPVRIPGVAVRIGKQTADPQLLVRRPADIRDAIAVPILVVRPVVVGIEPAQADRVIELVPCASELCRRFAKRIERTALPRCLNVGVPLPCFVKI